MGKYYLISRPVRTSDIDFADLQDTGESWHVKAKQLRVRRWRNLRKSINSNQNSKRHSFHRSTQKTF